MSEGDDDIGTLLAERRDQGFGRLGSRSVYEVWRKGIDCVKPRLVQSWVGMHCLLILNRPSNLWEGQEEDT